MIDHCSSACWTSSIVLALVVVGFIMIVGVFAAVGQLILDGQAERHARGRDQ